MIRDMIVYMSRSISIHRYIYIYLYPFLFLHEVHHDWQAVESCRLRNDVLPMLFGSQEGHHSPSSPRTKADCVEDVPIAR